MIRDMNIVAMFVGGCLFAFIVPFLFYLCESFFYWRKEREEDARLEILEEELIYQMDLLQAKHLMMIKEQSNQLKMKEEGDKK